MRILVFSDSHGRSDLLPKAFCAHGNIAMVIHLGDGARDVQTLQPLLDGRPLLQVRGNCDFASELPGYIVTDEGGKRLFCTHGHMQSVKYGTQQLIAKARDAGADIALYGHTHVQVQEYVDGMYVCNPGTMLYGQYALLEIVPQGVMWLPQTLK